MGSNKPNQMWSPMTGLSTWCCNIFFVLVSHLNPYLHTKVKPLRKKTLLHNFCCIYWITSDFVLFPPGQGWEGEGTHEKIQIFPLVRKCHGCKHSSIHFWTHTGFLYYDYKKNQEPVFFWVVLQQHQLYVISHAVNLDLFQKSMRLIFVS